MENGERALELERAHLDGILGVARGQLGLAERDSAQNGTRLTEARREMHEQTEQMYGNLWSSDDFEALANLNQLALPISVNQTTGEMLLARIKALKAMLDAPYFARIDLTNDDEDDRERIYIGRATLKDDQTHEIFVHDWRSPVASVFYRFGTGPVAYDAPGGRISGEMTLKRQFEIHGGKLEYFFDSDVEVQDSFLRGMLSQNASPRMKAIVETIQRDQDLAIRDTGHELMMVQGAAGSGKSSIALHRVAYLMYEGLSEKLSAGDILILSPNALFERYIHEVLPELGALSVATVTLEQLLSETLGGAGIEARGDRFERLCRGDDPAGRSLMRDSMAFKASPAFLSVLERFVRELPRRWIDFQDVCYGGETIATRQRLKQRALRAGEAAPLAVRLRRMEMSLWDGIHTRKAARMAKLTGYVRQSEGHTLETGACARAYSILECAALARHIRGFTRLNHRALYGRLVSDEKAFRRLANGLELPGNLGEILLRTRRALSGSVLPLEDATAITFLKLLTEGAHRHARIRQVVVDEAQDYDPMQYAVLGRLFPRARFTVLGDVNQALERKVDRTLYDRISANLNRGSALLVELNKSFRCTKEILSFSLRFLEEPGDIQSFNRSGDEPGEHAASSREEMVGMIAAEVALCREKGLKSIALITKTVQDARAWHAQLKRAMDVALIDSENAGETTGAFVIPLQLSKGLEFDAVLVLDAQYFRCDGEGRLLYVACTRALHRLNLYLLDARKERGERA